eukprot:6172840-Pleurochrysis_carterae.AAC.4
MRMRKSHGCILTALVVQGKGKGHEDGTLCERKNAPRPATPSMLIASVRRLQPPWAAATLASELGGKHEEAVTATGAAVDIVGVEAESSADAAQASWLKCASEPMAILRGVVGGVKVCDV